jgi:hypothetical protein
LVAARPLGRLGRQLLSNGAFFSRRLRLNGGRRLNGVVRTGGRLWLTAVARLLALRRRGRLLLTLRLSTLSTLPALVPLLVPLLIPTVRGHNPMIVFSVLKKVLRSDAIACGERVARQRLVLLDNLERRPPNLPLGAVALEVRAATLETA